MNEIGIVLAAHGDMAASFKESASLIVAELERVEPVSLDPSIKLESMQTSLAAAADKVDQGNGVLILLELFGGTPCNASIMVLQERECQAISGLNLPMLLEVAMQRSAVETVEELAQLTLASGVDGVVDEIERFQAVSNLD
ncbi:MAG: PTS sugar transporter subunit IIA [Anaerolineales bacterium]